MELFIIKGEFWKILICTLMDMWMHKNSYMSVTLFHCCMWNPMENMSSVPSTRPVIPFQSGSPIMIAGPTNSGKTVWVNRLLSHDMFTEIPKSILYCYGVFQKFFEEMKTNPDKKLP